MHNLSYVFHRLPGDGNTEKLQTISSTGKLMMETTQTFKMERQRRQVIATKMASVS